MASDALADRAAVPSRADTEDRLPLSLKVGWGFGAFGGAVLSNAVGGLVLYYLAKIVGMPGWLAGSLLSAARPHRVAVGPSATLSVGRGLPVGHRHGCGVHFAVPRNRL